MTRGRDLPKLNSNPTHPHVTNALPLPLHLVEDLISSKRSRCVWNNGVFFVVVPHRGKFGISCWLLLISSKTFSCLSFENSLICFNNGSSEVLVHDASMLPPHMYLQSPSWIRHLFNLA